MVAPGAQVLLGVACAAFTPPSSVYSASVRGSRVASNLVTCPTPPSVSPPDSDPGTFFANCEDGPEVSLVPRSPQRRAGLTGTREGTRKRQAGGAGAVGRASSSGPREPVANCSVGLEKNPFSLACRPVAPVAVRAGMVENGLALRETRVTALKARSLWPLYLEQVGVDTHVSRCRGFLQGQTLRNVRNAAVGPRAVPGKRPLRRPRALWTRSVLGLPGRRGGGAASGLEVVRAGGEGALWPAAAASSLQQWPGRCPRPPTGGRRPCPGATYLFPGRFNSGKKENYASAFQ
ncbi:uncharacterized protein LOC131418956 [Diceros bicornis minor]|uniref:uncharacterized protein LOC131418956 n=1 Tax=Diceros bicornis minor TaxID=77932 RepID=UPI0026EF297E|nr:uncharacterized protein LOC131418956 [Diceros bicornis minor]